MSTITFADGTTIDMNPADGVEVLGKDADGYVVVRAYGMEYALTKCCLASAKGCDGYIGCRSCYEPVDPKLGGTPDPVVVTVDA